MIAADPHHTAAGVVVVGRVEPLEPRVALARAVARRGRRGAAHRRAVVRAQVLLPALLLHRVLAGVLRHELRRRDGQVQQDGGERGPVARLRVPAHAHQQEEAGRSERRQRQFQRVLTHAEYDFEVVHVAVRRLARQKFPQHHTVRPVKVFLAVKHFLLRHLMLY